MNWSKLNPYKTPIIVGSFALGTTVALGSFFYGVKQAGDVISGDPQSSETQTQQVDLKIKGNRKSKIYHMRGCPNYNDLKESNIIWFKTKADAEAAGFRIARNC